MRTLFDKIAQRFWTPQAPQSREDRRQPIRINPALSTIVLAGQDLLGPSSLATNQSMSFRICL